MYFQGFVIRVYPNEKQTELAWKHVGASRYIWNYMLDLQQARHENGEKNLGFYDMTKMLTGLKNDGVHNWLKEISNDTLKCVCRNLSIAYQRFFQNVSGFPKLKSRKKSKPSFPIRSENTAFYFFDDRYITIPKLGKVKYSTDYQFPIGRKVCKFYNAHMFYKDNKWFVSFSMECENQAFELKDYSMGIDLGIKELAVVAVDDKQLIFPNINKSRKIRELEKQKIHLQKVISRKYEKNKVGNTYNKTNNIIRAEDKLRKIYHRLTGIRHNYLHQTTHKLVSMLPKRVVMETLNISGMLKNKHLSKAISDQGLFVFIQQMKYKCDRLGIEFIQADRFYPSSKTCSNCGNIKTDLKLSDRTYVCKECGFVADRDYNAALNLSRYVV